ncbi:hypothetical protein LUU34_01268800 [Aix galericulata]|nr:hypothetical protein LUU34_01268800 [Aix galericulata]
MHSFGQPVKHVKSSCLLPDPASPPLGAETTASKNHPRPVPVPVPWRRCPCRLRQAAPCGLWRPGGGRGPGFSFLPSLLLSFPPSFPPRLSVCLSGPLPASLPPSLKAGAAVSVAQCGRRLPAGGGGRHLLGRG